MAPSTILFFGLAGAVAIGSAAFTIFSSPLLGKRSFLTIVASGIALIIFASVSPSNYGKQGGIELTSIIQIVRRGIFSCSRIAAPNEMQVYR